MSAVKRARLAEWMEAAERLALSSEKNVDCPECGRNHLIVRDIEYGWGPCRGLERYLMCSHCGAYNIVNLRHAVSNGAMQPETRTDFAE
jgi:hypothetical protein